jgi:hypothetical protein
VVSVKVPVNLAEVIGMLETIASFGKDVVMRKNLSFASDRHVPSLELTWFFQT